MAGKKKHAERSRKTHSVHEDLRGFGLYRMSSIVERNNSIKSAHRTQRKG